MKKTFKVIITSIANSPVPIDLVLKYAKSSHKVVWQTIDRYHGEIFCY
jgi:hypothetical protein